ncbi:MAG: hypothetical protein K5637_04065 [Lachnospiraceae bacterium]|nr:hypothetical protein [Lachnospiraceae bacterium]
MAQYYQRRYNETTTGYYVDGNTVRELEPEIVVRPERKQKEAPARYEKRKAAYDVKYVSFLAVSVAAIVSSSILFLNAGMKNSQVRREISAYTSELKDIQDKNNAIEDGLIENLDLNDIYHEAAGRLGMVYADESQVVYYNSSNNDYIRQYGEINGN